MQNFLSKKIVIRLAILFFLAMATTVFFWQYLNKYLIGSKAAASAVKLTLIPTTATFSNQEIKEYQLTAQFTGGSTSEKIDYLKAKINFPKANLALSDYVDTTSSGLSKQFRVDGPQAANDSGVIVIELGAISPGSGPATSGPITVAKIKFKGISAITNGQIGIDSSAQIINNLSVAITPVNVEYATFTVNGTGPTVTPGGPTVTKAPTATPGGPTATPRPTSPVVTGTSGNVKLNMKVKFQGIIAKPASDTLNKLSVKVKLLNELTNQETDYQTIEFIADDSGIWSGSGSFNVFSDGNYITNATDTDTTKSSPSLLAQYTVYIKGPYHIQKKICDTIPTETAGGTYRCSKGNITLISADNDLDFSGIILLAGDLPVQDGSVTAYDTSLIYNNLGKTDNDICDVNRDGRCDTQDFSLVIASLSVKNDEL